MRNNLYGVPFYLNANSRQRADLHQCNIATIRFKLLIKDYEDWKLKMGGYGVTPAMFTEAQFNILMAMLSNTYLRYKTRERNLAYMSVKIQEFYALYLREKKLYDLDYDLLLERTATNEQKYFTINKSNVAAVSDEFLDNSVRSTATDRDNMISRLGELQAFSQMESPEILFLKRLVTSVVYPLQPNNINDDSRRGPWK